MDRPVTAGPPVTGEDLKLSVSRTGDVACECPELDERGGVPVPDAVPAERCAIVAEQGMDAGGLWSG